MKLPEVDFDGQWKRIIRNLHHPFMQFYFPELFKLIDFTIPPKFLDKELQKIIPKWGKKGKRESDMLIEYQLLSGVKQLVLIHVEIQGTYKKWFTKRMFTTVYRLLDQHPDHKVTALAVYTSNRIPKQYDSYEVSFFGMEIYYRFNTYLVREQNEKELIASKNPFALVTLAALYLIKAGHNIEERFRFKIQLGRLCVKNGYDSQFYRDLLNFVRFIIAIPEEKEVVFEQKIIEMSKSTSTFKIDPRWIHVMATTFGKTGDDFYSEIIKEYDPKNGYKVAKLKKAEAERAKKIAQLEAEAAQKAKKIQLLEVKKAQEIQLLEAETAQKAKEIQQLEAEAAQKAKEINRIKAEAEKAKLKQDIKSALALHKNGVSIAIIAKSLSLSEEKINAIIDGAKKKKK